MGRIKTGLVKRVTFDIIAQHKAKATRDFVQNKALCNSVLDHPNKKLRNSIAGYIARLMKNAENV